MMKHFDIGNIEGGYKDPSATLPSFRAINTAAPQLKECEMRMILDKGVAENFVEFKAHIASSGSVYIGTSSNAKVCCQHQSQHQQQDTEHVNNN